MAQSKSQSRKCCGGTLGELDILDFLFDVACVKVRSNNVHSIFMLSELHELCNQLSVWLFLYDVSMWQNGRGRVTWQHKL